MDFSSAEVTGVKADLKKRRIKLTFEVDLDEQPEAEELAFYIKKDGGLSLSVSPNQLAFVGGGLRARKSTGEIVGDGK